MNNDIKIACENFGWETVYQWYLPEGWEIKQRPGREEFEANSPFPGSTDKNPSFAFNGRTGLWADYHVMNNFVGLRSNGGNIIQFVAFMQGARDQHGRVLGDFDAAERELRLRLGLCTGISEEWYQRTRLAVVQTDHHCHGEWRTYKPTWRYESMVEHGIGWDEDTQRFVFPVRDAKGKLINCKLYRVRPSDTTPKMVWKESNIGPQGLPWPYKTSWSTKSMFWFVEGEGDALTLASFDIPAITGTLGATTIPFLGVYGNEFPNGRDAIVCTDEDPAGENFAARAIAQFAPISSSVRRVRVPEWEDMPSKRDVTDWIAHLLRIGTSREDIRRTLIAVSNAAEPIGIEARLDADPIDMEFESACDNMNYGVRFRTTLRVISQGATQHLASRNIEIACPENRGNSCRQCNMQGRNGFMRTTIDHRSDLVLFTATTDFRQRDRAVLRHLFINETCPSVRIRALTAVSIQMVQAVPPQQASYLGITPADTVDVKRMEVCVASLEDLKIRPGTEYNVRGFMYPAPRNQRAILLIDKAEPVVSDDITSVIGYDERNRLRALLQPEGMSASDAIIALAENDSACITGIKNRLDMHLMMHTLFHSAISFDFGGEHVARGWMETFIVGDTRCGKSAAFRSLSQWFGAGVLVDCKNVTIPGLLAAVETSNATGERYIIPGLMPLNDMEGPIAFDEYSRKVGTYRTEIIDALASARSEGVVTIVKAATTRLYARVRSIWMANPGEGKLIADMGVSGVSIIKKIVGQPEDIARFDAAMCVAQSDVDMDVLMSPTILGESFVSKEEARTILRWSRSRLPHQFRWSEDAIKAVEMVTRAMVKEYDASIPLVEAATQRHKVAKVSVAIAMSLFSTEDGVNVRIEAEHVAAALMMFTMWYQKASFGYHTYSKLVRNKATLTNVSLIQEFLLDIFGGDYLNCLMRLSSISAVNETTFRTITGLRAEQVGPTLTFLLANRCIVPVHGASYELTTAFVKWINGENNASPVS